jgi:cell division ATPase FtsA
MPKKHENYLGSFDIGINEVKIALAQVVSYSNSEKLEIISYANKYLHPWDDSKENLGDVLEELLSRAEANAKIKSFSYAGFPVSVESKNAVFKVKEATIPLESGTLSVDPQLLQQINKEAIEKFEEENSNLRILADYILGYKIDGDFYLDILGKEVDMLNVLIGAVYVPNKELNKIENYLDMIDIREYIFEYKPISASLFIPYEYRQNGCFQIHGEWQEFDIIYWYNGKAFSFEKLPYGMRMLSKDVEKIFNMNRDVAENLIFNDFKSIEEEDISEGLINVTLKTGEKSEISKQFFQRVVEARVDEIAEQIKHKIGSMSQILTNEYNINANDKEIYLTGSFVNLKGFDKMLLRYFGSTGFQVPSIEDAETIISVGNKGISNISNLSILGNLISYSKNVIDSQTNEKPKFFGFFKKGRRQ